MFGACDTLAQTASLDAGRPAAAAHLAAAVAAGVAVVIALVAFPSVRGWTSRSRSVPHPAPTR